MAKQKLATTFEAACAVTGQNPNVLPSYPMLSEKEAAIELAHFKLGIISRALNGEWEPDWNSYDEEKWQIVWDMETYGDGRKNDGFSLSDVNNCFTYSYVCSRLCFRTRKLAEHAAKHFPDTFRAYYKKS